MTIKIQRIVAIFLLICMLTTLLLSMSSCNISFSIFTKYRFDQKTNKISRIEIVEARVDAHTKEPVQKVLCNIDDVQGFIEEFKQVPYMFPILGHKDTDGIDRRELALKITYDNEEYELLTATNKSSFNINNGYHTGSMGTFMEEQFYTLLDKYLKNAPDQQFEFMHSEASISKISIVKMSNILPANENSALLGTSNPNVLAEIEDIEGFLTKLKGVEFNHSASPNFILATSADMVMIRITYENNEFELLTNNFRYEMHAVPKQSENNSEAIYTFLLGPYLEGSYMGLFNADEFYALLNEYIPEVSE